MSAEWPRSFEQALTADEPVSALRDAVIRARSDEADRETLERQLLALADHLAGAGRKKDEDVVLDVIDFLVGWCSPHMRIE